MLSARKLHLLAGLKVDGLDLRTRELDFYMTRFIAISSISSIMTCLAYVGLIKIKIPVCQPRAHLLRPSPPECPFAPRRSTSKLGAS